MKPKPLTRKQLERLLRKSVKNPHRSMESKRNDILRAGKKSCKHLVKIFDYQLSHDLVCRDCGKHFDV